MNDVNVWAEFMAQIFGDKNEEPNVNKKHWKQQTCSSLYDGNESRKVKMGDQTTKMLKY